MNNIIHKLNNIMNILLLKKYKYMNVFFRTKRRTRII